MTDIENEEEFASMRQEAMTEDDKNARTKAMIDNLWETYDNNNNGTLDKKECKEMIKEMCKGEIELRDDAFNDLFD